MFAVFKYDLLTTSVKMCHKYYLDTDLDNIS